MAIKSSVRKFEKEADQALDTSLDQTSQILKEFLITPLIRSIENPLQTLASANLESIYLIEEDVSSPKFYLKYNYFIKILILLLNF